jgi:hypothetical protein
MSSTPATAIAGPIAFCDSLWLLSSDGTLGRGTFHFDDIANDVGEDLVTFCIQRTQYIDDSSTFVGGGINDYTDDTGRPDYLAQTQWIYSMFAAGELDAKQPDAIKAAIWQLEGAWASDLGNSASLIAAADTALLGGVVATNVEVLNFFYTDGARAQDQLYMAPVAEPASILLFGTGLVAVLRHRMRTRSSV